MGLDPDQIPHGRPWPEDRPFLDANVLFSAAYREDAPLRALGRQPRAALLTSA